MHIADTSGGIAFFQLCARKAAPKLEIAGLHRSSGRRTAYSICKSEYGLRGNRASVLKQMQDLFDKAIADTANARALGLGRTMEQASTHA